MFKPNRLIYANETPMPPEQSEEGQCTSDVACEARTKGAEVPVGELLQGTAEDFGLKMEETSGTIKNEKGGTEQLLNYEYKTNEGQPVLTLSFNKDHNEYSVVEPKEFGGKVLAVSSNIDVIFSDALPKYLGIMTDRIAKKV